MKFKSIFLGMLGMAAIVSCNNESVINPETPVIDSDGDKIVASTGADTYMSLTLPQQDATTYAGESTVTAEAGELNVGSAAVFVYKWDGSNADAEAYAFIPTGYTTGNKIVMKVKDGTKKIFCALNTGTFFGANLPAAATTPDEGATWAVSHVDLNKVLWSNTTTGFTNTKPTAEGSANGLIKSLAGGAASFTDGVLKTPSSATGYFSMANWDSSVADTIIGAAGTYKSTCKFTFDPDVPKTDAQAGTSNQATVTVARAVAKISLAITAPSAGTNVYQADPSAQGGVGRFTPWVDGGTTGIWSLGNINKESQIFQEFVAGAVADSNYAYISCDPAVGNTDWYVNFDNIRVFGTGNKYLTNQNTVTNVKNAMTASQGSDKNNVVLGATNYQYCTENAQLYGAGFHDNSTFTLVGGQYAPEFWLSDIQQAAVPTNDPLTAYNNATIPVGSPAGFEIRGASYVPVGYSGPNTDKDSIFYHTGWKIFIYGKANLCKYYAWVKKADTDTPGTPSVPVGGQYGVGTALNPSSSAAVIAAINQDMADGNLVEYYQGNCFYRVFIKDTKALLTNEKVLVRRNHVYDVAISKILGPGIADPNDILVPHKPVLETDTYIAVTINIQDWHKVTQNEEVKGE